jgi:hypothetical protein
MTTEFDTTRAVRAWLEEGVTHLPDRVLDAVLADVPHTPQQARANVVALHARRSTWLRLLVAVMTLALVGTSLIVASGALRSAPIPRPFELRPLEAGRYVIGHPFPVRISLDLPAGWEGQDVSPTGAYIGHVDEASDPGKLTFALVDAVYPDPCQWDAASIELVGPGTKALTDALATLDGVGVGPVTEASLGGYPSRTFTLSAPPSFAGCSTTDPQFMIWGHPEGHSLSPGERNQIWVTQVGSTRLVVSSEVFPDTPAAVADELAAIVASIRFEQFAAIAVPTPPPPPTPTPTHEPEWPLANPGVPLKKGGFFQNVHLYEWGTDGVPRVLQRGLAAAFEGQPGWFGSDPGIVSDLGTAPQARLGWWSVAKVYLDPCHWQTSAIGTADPPLMRTQDGLADALSGWWPTETDPKVSSGYEPAAGAPVVVQPPKLIVSWGLVQRIDLEIPSDIDLASCDGGEYRVWEAIDGRVRTAGPGERIQLEIADFEPGLLVIDTASLSTAPRSTLDALRAARDSLYLGRVSGRRL